MAAPPKDLLVLDNSLINELLTNQRILALMPGLRNPPIVEGRQTGCCGQPTAIDYAKIKTMLATMPSSTIRTVKEVLNARQIRFYRQTQHQGKPAVVKVTR